MSVFIVRLPDVGEGVAEAELVAWHVGIGDVVTTDTRVAEVLTDKATVEIFAPVSGTVAALHGQPGDVLAVGSDFIGIDTLAAPPHPEPERTGTGTNSRCANDSSGGCTQGACGASCS